MTMNRKDYLERMQRAACGARTDHELVQYKGGTYYPDAYILSFDRQGKSIHKARLHDLHANSVQECQLDAVEPIECSEDNHATNND